MAEDPGKIPTLPAPISTAKRFEPNHAQKALFAAAVQDPWLVHDRKALCAVAEIKEKTAERWFSEWPFRAWWNEQLLELARICLGPSTMHLAAMFEDESVTAAVKVRALETMLKVLGPPNQNTNMGHAVAAILEKWSGRGKIRLAARGEELAMEVAEMAHSQAGGDGSALQNLHYRKLEPGEEPGPDDPPSPAVQVSPGSVNQTARAFTEGVQKAIDDVKRQERGEPSPEAAEPKPLRCDRAHPSSGMVLRGRAVRNHNGPPLSPNVSDTYKSPNPQVHYSPHTFTPGDSPSICRICDRSVEDHGQRLDPFGRAFTERGEEETKAPPGSGE